MEMKLKVALRQRTKRQRRRAKRSRPPPRRWPPSQTIPTTSWPSSRPLQSNHRRASLSLCIQERPRLVPSLDIHQPPHDAQAVPTRPHGSHWRLDRRGNEVTHRGSALPCRCRPAQDPTDGPTRHPGGERCQRNLHSELDASHNSPLPQREEHDVPSSRLLPDLYRETSLPNHLLLSGPSPRAHPGHPGPGRANRNIASSDPSIFIRTRECPAAGTEDPSPPINGIGTVIKGGSGRATGTDGPRARIHTRAAALNAELCEVSGGLPRSVDPNFLVDGNVAV